MKKLIYPTFNEVKYFWESKCKKNGGYSNSHLYVKFVEKKGLGVFPKRDIKAGEVIEYCHSIVLETPRRWQKDSQISKYCYWSHETGIMPLGFGPIYNSAEREDMRNCNYFTFPESALVIFVAIQDIPANEEILVWWGEDYYKSWCLPRSSSER